MRSLLISLLVVLLAAAIQAEVFKREKVKLGKKTCTCDFNIKIGDKCSGSATCDKKCSGSGIVELGGCSLTLAVKKGKGKISKCSCEAATTPIPPTEPSTGSGSGETPVPITGSGSGETPVPITGSGSGETPVPIPTSPGSGSGGPPPAGEGMQCSCKCNCPDGSGECDCDCNCPMTSKALACAPGFSKVCPMKGDMCPQDMDPVCPYNAMSRMAGSAAYEGMDKGCQCVPDFLLAVVMIQPTARKEAVDRAMTKATIQVGKKKCKCSYEMNADNCKKSKITCDKKCSGKATGVELADGDVMYMVDMAIKKGKVTISKCDVDAPEPTGTGTGGGSPGSGSGNGGGGVGGMGSRCACVSKGMGGSGPTVPTLPPTGSGSEPIPPTGSGSEPPTGSGSEPPTGSGSEPPTGSGSGSGSSTVAPPVPDLISNGDFSSGSLSPWSCTQATCQVTDNVLYITERSAEWSGIKQDIPVEGITNEDDLKVVFEFQIKSPEAITAKWKVKVINSGEIKYFTIHTVDVDNQEWENIFSKLSLPTFLLGSDQLQLYLEVTPAEADISLDNISLKPDGNQTGDWEEEANQRIDVLRKRNVEINLNLESINSLDIQIEIEQKNHKFPFGTAVKSPRIAECYDANEDNLYCDFVRDNFNWLVDTYRMKWKPMEPTKGDNVTEIADKMIAWAHSYEKTVRGHALLWAKQGNNPAWVQDLYGEELKTAIFNRVNFAMKHFEEYNVPHWDVINEMIDQGHESHTFYLDHTGDPEIRENVFKYAKELSPDTLLFVNDYGVIMNKNGRFSLYQEQIRELLAAGAPIDAIGLQSHMNGDEFVNVDLIKYHVDILWEEFGLPIWVTEFDWNGNHDVDMGDHSYHAEQVENFYRLMFSHEAVTGILMWKLNILDETTDLPNKAGETYQRLYHQEWRSSQVIKATAERNTFKGFLGDYSMKILQGTVVLGEIEFTLDKDLEITCTGDASNIICS